MEIVLDTKGPAERRLSNEAALTAEQARELFSYDAASGKLRWKVARRGTKGRGSLAGSPTPRGFRTLLVNGRRYYVHRVAFLVHHGRWPRAYLDHIDGDRSNNRASNLREATGTPNAINREPSGGGLKGAHRNRNCFLARIKVHGATVHLGSYKTPEEAHAVYVTVAHHLFGGAVLWPRSWSYASNPPLTCRN